LHGNSTLDWKTMATMHKIGFLALSIFLASCGGGGDDGGGGSTSGGGGGGSGTGQAAACMAQISPEQALEKINAARAVARQCGDTAFGAAPALRWNDKLAAAAAAHSADMAARNYFSHTNLDGLTPADRTQAAGYGRSTGENIAVGQRSMDEAIAAWLKSPGHCSNIMSTRYQDYAIGCAPSQSAQYGGSYWTQSFGIQTDERI
jgi:uncharacterized protein YkwD